MACKLLVMGFRGSPVRIRPSRLAIRHTLQRFPPLRGISLLGADRLQVTSRLHKLPAHGLNRGHRTRLVPGLGCHPQPVTATQSIRPQRSPNPKAEMPQAVAVLGLSVPCRLSYVAIHAAYPTQKNKRIRSTVIS